MKDTKKYTFTATAAEARMLLLGVASLVSTFHDRKMPASVHRAELLSKLFANMKRQERAPQVRT